MMRPGNVAALMQAEGFGSDISGLKKNLIMSGFETSSTGPFNLKPPA